MVCTMYRQCVCYRSVDIPMGKQETLHNIWGKCLSKQTHTRSLALTYTQTHTHTYWKSFLHLQICNATLH